MTSVLYQLKFSILTTKGYVHYVNRVHRVSGVCVCVCVCGPEPNSIPPGHLGSLTAECGELVPGYIDIKNYIRPYIHI